MNQSHTIRRRSYPTSFIRRPLPVLSALYGRADPYRTFYASMFVDDLRTSVQPFSLKTRVADHVVITPDSPEAKSHVQSSTGGYDAADGVRRFLEDCTGALALTGRAIFEVAYSQDIQRSRTTGIRLLPISLSSSYLPIVGAIQHLSERAQDKEGRGWVRIGAPNVVQVKLPPRLRKGWRRMIQTLIDCSDPLIPEFAMPSVGRSRREAAFDLAEFSRNKLMAVARATSKVGWRARGEFADEQNSYTAAQRFIRWMTTRIEFREAALGALNNAYRRFSGLLEMDIHVDLKGVVAHEDVDAASRELSAGLVSLDTIYDRLQARA